jgi:diguanylate cyclase (GGDEF)-like protein
MTTDRPDADDLRRGVVGEALLIGVLTAAVTVCAAVWDLPEVIDGWSRRSGVPVDDLVLVLAVSHLFMLVFGARRGRQLKDEHSGRREAEAEASYLTSHDQLTGLFSREAFRAALGAAVPADRTDPVAMALLDLDGFGRVNATLGNSTGSRLLRAVAGRLSDAVPEGTVLARLGADDFGLLLTGPAAADPAPVLRHVLDRLAEPVAVGEVVLEVTAHVGFAHGVPGDRDETMRRADVAFARARADRVDLVAFSPAIDTFDADNLVLLSELRQAVRSGEIRAHYQPQVDMARGRVVGVEALLRWQHPRRGLVFPGAFIELAEQAGLIGALTELVLAQALADSRRWADAGCPLRVAVNLSAQSLTDPAFPAAVAAATRAAGVRPGAVDLEVTETAALEDPARATLVLAELRALGFRLSVDDFGTGHSSLAYLTQLPVHVLKVDRSFVQAMGSDPRSQTVVRTIVGLAHDLGLSVVAEGVEDEATHRELTALGCEEAQGFWYSRAVPPEDVPSLARELAERLRTAVAQPA